MRIVRKVIRNKKSPEPGRWQGDRLFLGSVKFLIKVLCTDLGDENLHRLSLLGTVNDIVANTKYNYRSLVSRLLSQTQPGIERVQACTR